ncbi:MAG: bifunctional 4-hydroxy-2-oxoglutarate aldolase/2-dehydro-3-deoxy-phosphogluconate aldolase [Gammaproteobacteria bacterium]|nr:bifunctional 4-hydroxy-2-oxoglutarate aldolase/2-dehydro-3-deoxy-phosphogluconate aldolase [Gammaproteobacteria bacterium]
MSFDSADSLQALLGQFKVVPVLTVSSVESGLAVCRALQAGGIRGVEITLRTPVALEVIAAVRDQLDGFHVGAGTVKTVNDLRELKKLDVAFAVSPGFTRRLSDCAFELDVPLLPGVATASEILAGLETGRNFFKLFPAQAVGGIPLLKSLAAPFAEACFCPTGGVSPDNFRDYLALPNVVCVGGSWMVNSSLLEQENWQEVTRLSRECMA